MGKKQKFKHQPARLRQSGGQPPSRRQIRHAAWLAKWRAVDWSKQNIELAAEMGRSHERIRQIRTLLGVPPSPHHWRHRSVRRALQWTRENLGKLRGLTLAEIRKEYGLKMYSHGAIFRFLKAQQILRDGRLKHPWSQMNFALPNRELDRIWRLPSNLAASHRWLQKLPSSRWKVNRGLASLRKRGQLAAYLRALKAEEKKARLHFKR